MFSYVAKKIFGTKNDRALSLLKPKLSAINELQKKYESYSDDQLRACTGSFKEKLDNGATLDDILPESFALVREAAWRTLSMRHFDVQIIGGMVLHQGSIAEMKTGEGKTLVATLPTYLNALSGKGVHVVTVNDYLAKRDSEWMGQVFRFLGLTVGVVVAGISEEERQAAYRADITYGQNNEFGFDFLRDNMRFDLSEMVQREHNYAVVDEVDSILIDEARTPLIISGPADESTDKYYELNKLVPHLKDESDYSMDLKSKTPTLTDEGVSKVEKLLGIENLYDPVHVGTVHHVNQALRAHNSMQRDVDYVVKDGQIVIVDEFTGRLMPGRRWSKGLHQAVEAKENCKVQRESQTLASITFQNYFRMYDKLSGMTGTADTESAEFKNIYSLEVVVIPTHKPLLREDHSDKIFKNKKDKYNGVVEEIEEINKTGQPVLVGTISIDQSELASKLLKEKNIPHNVLNAKKHAQEADIVAQAGRLGAVTISTNMAGRGTDILLGGNPEFLAYAETKSRDWDDPKNKQVLEKYKSLCEEEKEKVLEAGGLCILGTERHESRRIDNQLRGRAGRQGDPGASRFFVSLEDELIIRFGGEKIQQLLSMPMLGWEDGLSIDSSMVSNKIEDAQKRVESMHFEGRKYVTEYDDVMNKQRQVVYDQRLKIFKGETIAEDVKEMLDDVMESMVLSVCKEDDKPVDWNVEKLAEGYKYICNVELNMPSDIQLSQQALFDFMRSQAWEALERNRAECETKLKLLREVAEKRMESGDTELEIEVDEEFGDYTGIERRALLEALDQTWNFHLRGMDDLREGIGLRAFGQKNPLYEYQQEAFQMFQNMLLQYKQEALRKLFYLQILDPETFLASIEAEEQRRKRIREQMSMNHQQNVSDEDSEDSQDPQISVESAREKMERRKKMRRRKSR